MRTNTLSFLLILMLYLTASSAKEPGETLFSKIPWQYNPSIDGLHHGHHQSHLISLKEIRLMLEDQTTLMNPEVIHKVLTTLKCAKKYNHQYKPTLVVIDYAMPSSEKRFWIFDLSQKKLLFHTHVSHGIKSGRLTSNYFSNRNNSKASSLGVFETANAYYGRHGLSLKLTGLEKGFNQQAFNRAIVIHGGWYMDENFIQKYGRPGRSWGCPALPEPLTKPIIDTIKDGALLIAYYPHTQWLIQSKYLTCDRHSPIPMTQNLIEELSEHDENRDKILFVEKNNNHLREENEPIIVVSADHYQTLFQTPPPLRRMLRCQMNGNEFIALNENEFERIMTHHPELLTPQEQASSAQVFFVIPEVKKVRGYYKTFMKIVKPGAIRTVTKNSDAISADQKNHAFTLHLEGKPALQLKSTSQFIRWLGL